MNFRYLAQACYTYPPQVREEMPIPQLHGVAVDVNFCPWLPCSRKCLRLCIRNVTLSGAPVCEYIGFPAVCDGSMNRDTHSPCACQECALAVRLRKVLSVILWSVPSRVSSAEFSAGWVVTGTSDPLNVTLILQKSSNSRPANVRQRGLKLGWRLKADLVLPLTMKALPARCVYLPNPGVGGVQLWGRHRMQQ